MFVHNAVELLMVSIDIAPQTVAPSPSNDAHINRNQCTVEKYAKKTLQTILPPRIFIYIIVIHVLMQQTRVQWHFQDALPLFRISP